MEKKLAPHHWGILYLIALILIAYLSVQVYQSLHKSTRVTVMNVGQGDAVLIQTPEHKNILVDAGPDGSLIYQLDKHLGFFNRKIDLFVLTHPHRDHFMGMLEAMEKYPFKAIMITGVGSEDVLYVDWIESIKAKNIPIFFPNHEQDWQLGRNLVLDIVYPFAGQGLIGQTMKNKNNASIVGVLRSLDGKSLMLLTGDAEKEEEREILLSAQDLESPVLKLGHHGSRTSTSIPFLRAVKPTMAVLSAGVDNSFKHPHPETLEKMERKEVELYRTDVNGAVEFRFR